MKVIRREFFNVARSDRFVIVPIGDVHLGAKACDEELLKHTVSKIKNTPNYYWIGMGDFCDYISLSDPRFNAGAIADWIKLSDLHNLSKVQTDRFVEMLAPIADKCLGLVKGNHEDVIRKHYERDIYLDIVNAVKQEAGFPETHKLALGYCGWLRLAFYSDDKNVRTVVDTSLHHGFVGGKLKGSKALNMERWLWTHDCDLTLMGHSHNKDTFSTSTIGLDHRGNIKSVQRRGAFTGTFLKGYSEEGSTYSEVKGYFPQPVGTIEVVLQPGAYEYNERVKIVN
jgi:hypothetical protein